MSDIRGHRDNYFYLCARARRGRQAKTTPTFFGSLAHSQYVRNARRLTRKYWRVRSLGHYRRCTSAVFDPVRQILSGSCSPSRVSGHSLPLPGQYAGGFAPSYWIPLVWPSAMASWMDADVPATQRSAEDARAEGRSSSSSSGARKSITERRASVML